MGILEVLDNSDLGLDDYEDNDGTKYYDLSEIANMLNNLNESGFYKKLDDLVIGCPTFTKFAKLSLIIDNLFS